MYEISIDWRIRKAGEKHYLVGQNRAIELNGSALYFIEKMLDGMPRDTIIAQASQDFGVDSAIIQNDLEAFAKYLRSAEIIR